jgi:hypothetical protein
MKIQVNGTISELSWSFLKAMEPSANFAGLSSTQRNRQRASLVFPQRNETISELRCSFLNTTEQSASFAEPS